MDATAQWRTSTQRMIERERSALAAAGERLQAAIALATAPDATPRDYQTAARALDAAQAAANAALRGLQQYTARLERGPVVFDPTPSGEHEA